MKIPTLTAQTLSEALAWAGKAADRPWYEEIYRAPSPPPGASQMLFFLKPELMRSPRLGLVAGIVTDALSRHGLAVEGAAAMTGAYLDKHGLVAAHYGVIDAVTRDPATALSQQARDRFRALYGHDADARVVGGLAYLERHPELDAEALARKWLARGADKLGGGTYCQELKDEGCFLVNGFYPRMLRHFTAPAARIAVFVLRGDTSWAAARQSFCGATDPLKAAAGSLRAELLRRQQELGLPEVSANFNGVHLSAGPLEALVELRRFASDLSRSPVPRPPEEFLFGRMLAARLPAARLTALLGNPTIATASGARSAFDLTEEKTPDEALEILSAL